MRAPSANFLTDKNLETNKPIWLYRINITDSPASGDDGDIYFAEYNADVAYYETNSGVVTARTYLAFPISHGGITENTENRIDTLEVNISNVSREIQAFVELYDGLRGHKVTLRRVFATHLADSSAYVEDIYYIDSVTATAETISFRLTSRLDVLKVYLPRRRVLRNHCPWTYKGQGCWIEDDAGNFTAPTLFHDDQMNLTASTAGIGSASNAVICETDFTPVSVSSFSAVNDSLLIDVKVTNASALMAASQIEISSSATTDLEEYYIADLTSMGLEDNVWKSLVIPFSTMTATGGAFDKTDIKRIRIYSQVDEPLYMEWKNAKIRCISDGLDHDIYSDTVESTHSYAYLQFHSVDAESIGLAKATDFLVVDLRLASGTLDTAGYLEMASSTNDFSNAWRYSDLSGLGISNIWQTFTLAFDDFAIIGSGPDLSNILRVQWFDTPAAGTITYYIRNAKIKIVKPYTFEVDADACARTLKDCRRHNNALQFGGYPNVPSKRIFRA